MIEIKDKVNCSGCSACYNICPKHAIQMVEDEEGFLYPEINKELCIHCDLCSKICPNIKNMKATQYKTKALAVYNKDEMIRKDSTSGGIFTAIAEEIINNGGIVFGASFNESFEIEHSYTESIEKLGKFRGSKYVQSKIGNTYQQVKGFLDSGRLVLFSGTPCQIAGLKAYLQKEYENLYTLEVFCKGVSTPKLWKKYIDEMQQKRKIKSIKFREKTYGFHSTTMTIRYEKGKKYVRGHESDPILNLFVQEMISRPSCYKCNYRGTKREADFSIGDLWHAGDIVNKYKDEEDKGISLLLLNSEKAQELVNKIKNIEIQEIDLNNAIEQNANKKNCALINDPIQNSKRTNFFQDMNIYSYKDLIKKYSPTTIKTILKSNAKKILFSCGVLEKVKRKK